MTLGEGVISPHLENFISAFFNDMGIDGKGLHIMKVPADGSCRIFWRLIPKNSDRSFILMSNTPVDVPSRRENFAYLKIGRHLYQKGVPVPEIYSFSLDRGWFIMEDFGSITLQKMLFEGKGDIIAVYEEVLKHLIRLQIEGVKDFDPAWCCETESYDRHVMRHRESDYFKDAFLRLYLGLEGECPGLENAFNYLADIASKADGRFLIHRDFQSRNIMITKGGIGIVDWQGARLGPLAYDLSSLIIDPYTDLSPQERIQLYDRYMVLLGEYDSEMASEVETYYPYLAIQRGLQILGAFSYLTEMKQKSYFKSYIPRALRTLQDLLQQVSDPELISLRQIVGSVRL
jgi:aminoglycoside/choline kinase family phosphotransferase